MEENKKKLEQLIAENKRLRAENITFAIQLKKFKFLARLVGHDLRGPIANAVTCVKLSRENVEDLENLDDVKKFLQIAEVQSQGALDLITNILTWARMQQDGAKICLEKLDLKSSIMSAISASLYTSVSKGINLRYTINGHVFITTDKGILQTIVMNIFTNAVKFTNKNGNITISDEEEENFVKIVIKDDGIGMSQEKVQKIFETVGVSSWGTENEKGTGLGLSICKDLADMAGMLLEVQSEGEGKGTTFTISIPNSKK